MLYFHQLFLFFFGPLIISFPVLPYTCVGPCDYVLAHGMYITSWLGPWDILCGSSYSSIHTHFLVSQLDAEGPKENSEIEPLEKKKIWFLDHCIRLLYK